MGLMPYAPHVAPDQPTQSCSQVRSFAVLYEGMQGFDVLLGHKTIRHSYGIRPFFALSKIYILDKVSAKQTIFEECLWKTY